MFPQRRSRDNRTASNRGAIFTTALAFAAVFAQSASWSQQLLQPLFLPATAPRTASLPLAKARYIVRERDVAIDPRILPPGDRSAPNGLRLNFFDDTVIDVYLDRLQYRGPKDYTWLGGIAGEDEPDGLVLVVKDDAVMINVRSINYGVQELRPAPGGGFVAREIDPELLPSCGNTPQHEVSLPSPFAAPRVAKDAGGVVDILVVYTPAARTAAGGVSAIEAAITLAIADANEAYLFSNIPAQLRLVRMEEVAYTENGDSSVDLARLQNPADGFMDGVHALRNTYGADVVALVNEATDVCGIGYLMTSLSPAFESLAFSVTVQDCLTELTLAHEVGHNFGAKHAVGDAGMARGGAGLTTYSYGWRWTGLSGNLWRSVMAYPAGTRVARFSNPDVLYDGVATGVPIGTPDEADNAASISLALSTASNWRATVTPMTVSPPGSVISDGPVGGPFSPNAVPYTVLNSGGVPINWTASNTQSWITLSSNGGSLASGSSANVTASINSNATALPVGFYADTITFTDTTFNTVTTRSIVLILFNQAIQSFALDTDPGWITQGAWAFGTPQGVGGDPVSGRTGSKVYGYNLAGLYPANMPEQSLTTSAFNCLGFTNVSLKFWRWLGVEDSTFDHARIDVSNNGSTWTTVWNHSGPTLVDRAWQLQVLDISAVANNQSTVYVRWVMGASDSSVQYGGWNIDDVALFGTFATPTNLSEAWVNFAYAGTELGTTANPFNTLAEAVTALRSDGAGVIKIKGNTATTSSNERPRLTKPMSVQAVNGAIRIGIP